MSAPKSPSMTYAEWHAQGQAFAYNSHDIFYREAGEGAPLVLLHGFPTASWDWHRIWQPLVDRYHLIAPDFIGFGHSAKPRSYDYSLVDQADLVEALLKEKGIAKVHVLAHDYGDSVAQELLARHIERQGKGELQLLTVCFLNGGIFPDTHRPLFIQKALASPIGFLLTPFLTKKKLRKSFENIFGPDTQPTAQEIDEFYDLIDRNKGQGIFHKLIRYMPERRRQEARWVGALEQSPLPMRFINGAMDPISGKHVAEKYRKQVPGADVVLLERIGHYPQTEDPEAVLEAYLKFREAAVR